MSWGEDLKGGKLVRKGINFFWHTLYFWVSVGGVKPSMNCESESWTSSRRDQVKFGQAANYGALKYTTTPKIGA